MIIEKVEGIVVNEKSYGESSKIIDILTKEHGMICVIAKGAKKLKSKLRGVSCRLTYGYFQIYYKEGKISTLIEADAINNFRVLKSDLMKLSYATFICELAGQVIKQIVSDDDSKVIYDFFVSTLLKINEGYNEVVMTNILELKLLPYLGVTPMLNECAICGNTTEIITVNADKYGFLCKNCRTNEYIVSDKTIKLLRMLYYVDISKISKLDISDRVINEINMFIDEFYDKHTGLYLKSKQFLKAIK